MNDAERRVVKTNSDCGDRSLSGELKKIVHAVPQYMVLQYML